MKIYINCFILILTAFLFIGCHDLLDENYTRDPVADVYYQTPAGFEDAVALNLR